MMKHEPASELRKCRQCGESKVSSAFRPDKIASNGRHYPRNQCRQCENAAWRRDWLAGKKERQSALVLAVNAPPVLPNGAYAKLEQAIGQRMIRHQSDALDAIFDLAMLPVSTNSAVMRIKLAAATLLAGRVLSLDPSAGAALEETLRDLNEAYHRAAPRIKAVRYPTITFETSGDTAAG